MPEEDYAALARAAAERGEWARAKELYERVWDFRAAAACAQALSDRPEALRLLLDAQALPEAAALGATLGPELGELERAAAVYERKRMWAQAAELRERMGAFAAAAELYGRADAQLERGRALELAGQPRAAGLAYERLLADAPAGPDAPAVRLRLARLLAGFGRHEEAVRHLQKIAGTPELGAPARRLLVRELDTLGWSEAARHVLALLRVKVPELPETLEEFLHTEPPPAPLLEADGERAVAGRYRMLRLLAAGGTGRVYLAEDTLLGGEVALKLFAAPSDARGREAYQRFVREARIVRSLRHGNLVAVRDVDEALGLLVMEYLPGGTLADRLAPRRPLVAADARRVALEVLAALEAAHQRGVVHRDLKPANILFDGAGTAKLGDFGVAHLVDAGQTQTAGLIGTLAYMSPEQVTGAPITFAADLYALGVTLFEMLCGRLPFPGPDFVAQHLGDPVPATGLGPAWDAVIARLLAKVPQARFDSIEQARAALQAIAIGEPAPARTPTPPRLGTALAPAGAESEAERYRDRRPLFVTAWSQLEEAVDARLERRVVIERFRAPLGKHLQRLQALARAGGPHLQRLLHLDAQAPLAVFEAPEGKPVASPAASAADLASLLYALGDALAPLHEDGWAHGAVCADHVVLDGGAPVLLVAGAVAPEVAGSAPGDVADAVALAGSLAGADGLRARLGALGGQTGAELATAAQALIQELEGPARARALLRVLAARARQHGLPAAIALDLLRVQARRLGLRATDAEASWHNSAREDES